MKDRLLYIGGTTLVFAAVAAFSLAVTLLLPIWGVITVLVVLWVVRAVGLRALENTQEETLLVCAFCRAELTAALENAEDEL